MKKIVVILSVALAAALVVSAAAGHVGGGMPPRFLKQATLIQGEYSSVAIDETPDGKVLRVVREGDPPDGPNRDIPCGECAPQCGNAYDDDGDRLADYPRDPGCTSYDDPEEWNPAPPPPPPPVPPPPVPPPPPPIPPPPPPAEWQWTLMDANPPDYQGGGGDECMDVIPCSLNDPTVIRCKVYVFVLKPHEGHFGIDFGPAFKYEGRWRICYRPYGGGITEVSYRIGDATDTYNLWEWRGNDAGYPSHIREAHRVFVRYGGGAAICIGGQWGCGPERHFRLTHTFKDTGLYGTITKVVDYM
jgi:hypothetical protein